MSLTEAPSGAAHSPIQQRPAHKPRLERKLKQALDNMALQGMFWQAAAKAANYRTDSMWRALQSPHAQAYLRKQRQVFRASLVDEATHRMRALSKQDSHMAAAVTATAKLMSEEDQSVNRGPQQSAPGFVILIQTSQDVGKVVGTTIEMPNKPAISGGEGG